MQGVGSITFKWFITIGSIIITCNIFFYINPLPEDFLTDVQTDVQNVPVDTFNGTLKLRLSLMYV